MDDRAEAWLRRRTSHWQDWPAEQLLTWKREQGVRISVVIPARDEEATVGAVAAVVHDELVTRMPLVDELVVMDSDSSDATAAVAADAGAAVHRCREVAVDQGGYPGKGEALWKSLFVTTGDIVVFLDADLTRWGHHFVTGLLGPLLCSPGGLRRPFDPPQGGDPPDTPLPRGTRTNRGPLGLPPTGLGNPAASTGLGEAPVQLVKAWYDRGVDTRSDGGTVGGGRVTELVARPMLNLWWPELAGVAQPLSGEWAARRTLLESLPVPVGYGVEIAVLIDTARRHGVDAIAQVDLGERGHSHQSDADLAIMAAELMVVTERRRPGSLGGMTELGGSPELIQFTRSGGELRARARAVPYVERPPARSLLSESLPSGALLSGARVPETEG